MSLESARYPQIFNEFPTVNVDAGDIILVYKPSTGQLHGILGSDAFPGSDTDTTTFIWSAATTYATDDVAVFNDLWYRSLQDSNLNNIPATGSAFWTQINRVATTTIPDWTAGLYLDRATVFVNNVLYRIRGTVSLPFNSTVSPDTDTTNWLQVVEGNLSQITLDNNFDSVRNIRFTGPYTFSATELYNGVTTVQYETALDGASPTFAAQANIAAVNTWITTNVTTGTTKWILRLIANPTKQTQIDLVFQ